MSVFLFQSTPSQRGRPVRTADRIKSPAVFQSTPSQRGRLRTCITGNPERYFNPRPRKEGDLFHTFIIPFRRISIHALAKRATVKQRADLPVEQNFNPRPRKEGDRFINKKFTKGLTFQSTPSQRGRRSFVSINQKRPIFQSTPS